MSSINHYVIDCNQLRRNDKIRSEVDVFVVLESDYDARDSEANAAQVELAALREENERLKAESFEGLYNEAIGERDALREELATMQREFEVGQQNWVDGMKSLTAAEQRNVELLKLLRSASIDYASCLESGYDRITMLGGDCDSVSKMLADNPNYTRYCAALKPTESGASE